MCQFRQKGFHRQPQFGQHPEIKIVGDIASKVPPDPLNAIEPRRIGRQEIEPQLRAMCLEPLLDGLGFVNAKVIQDDGIGA